MPKNLQRNRDRRDIPQNADKQDPRIRYAVDFFGNRDNQNYRGDPIDAIFGKKPSAYNYESYHKEFPMYFAAKSPEMEAINSLVQYMSPNKGLVFTESQDPILTQDMLGGNPSRIREYQSRSSRGAGTRKRLYKAEGDENDPRERGKKVVEDIKGAGRNAYNYVTSIPSAISDVYSRGKSGKENYRTDSKNPLMRIGQMMANEIYRTGKSVNAVEESAKNTRRKVDYAGKVVSEMPKDVRRTYESGRTGSSSKPLPSAAANQLIRGAGGIVGFLQGVNEALGNPTGKAMDAIRSDARKTGERQAQLRGGNTTKRATAPKMARKTTVASSRQAGFVNGRPVSLKKRANTSMKYFK